MRRFYQEILGFKLLGELPSAALLEVSEDRDGDAQLLALFQRHVPVSEKSTGTKHIVFTISVKNFDAEKVRLESAGLRVATNQNEPVECRSLCIHDPESNLVQLVCCCAGTLVPLR